MASGPCIFIRHLQAKAMVQLPFTSAVAARCLVDALVRTSPERGNCVGIRARDTLVTFEELSTVTLPVAIKDGGEYMLVLDTTGISHLQILSMLDEKLARIVAARSLHEQAVKLLEKELLPELCWSTCHIEGNPITQSEVRVLLERGMTSGAYKLSEYVEIQGAANAYAKLHDQVPGVLAALQAPAWEQLLLGLHKQLQATDESSSGVWRSVKVRVGDNFDCPDPDQLPELMQEFCSWLSSALKALNDRSAARSEYVLLACEAHMRFVIVHPFEDGNGRISRLLVTAILLPRDFPVFSVPGEIGGHYYDLVGLVQRSVMTYGDARAYTCGAITEAAAGGAGLSPFAAFVRLCTLCVNERLDTYLGVLEKDTAAP